jgi:zinc transport system ATP-binding protein
MLKIKNLSVEIGENKVLSNVNLDLEKGEIGVVIGLNGAGKSTLLKSIIGEITPNKGSIKLATKKISYIPQKLWFDRSIPVLVSEFMENFSQSSTSEIREALASVDAQKLFSKRIGELSGGQLQRVLIANAILDRPEILLLDEAASGLDISGNHKFYDLIAKLNEQLNMTILMVSHDLHTVFAKANKVFCLNVHMCCSGTPEKVSSSKEFQELFCKHLSWYKHHHNHKH